MKITIYELLGLIKDDEAPKKIRAYGFLWKMNEEKIDYIRVCDNATKLIDEYLENVVTISLNDEVEIIEDDLLDDNPLEDYPEDIDVLYSDVMSVEQDKKIEELVKSIECVEDISYPLGKLEYHYEQTKDEICEKINELVRAYNSLRENK